MRPIHAIPRVLLAALVIALAPAAHAQTTMRGATSPAPNLAVVLTWPIDGSVQRFNVYRRIVGQSDYPAAPLNSSPLVRMTNCAAIQTIVPVGSPDWKVLEDQLGDGPTTPFDPCAIATIAPGSPKEATLQLLARARWPIAVIAGQGHRDANVTSGTRYEYQLREVNAAGTEIGVSPGLVLTAGIPTPLPPPGGLAAAAGDGRVLLGWGNQNDAAGFLVFRATAAGGPFQRVNETALLTQINRDVSGKPIAASNGFLDIRRWDPSGQPTTHDVQGVAIGGPANGVHYFYRVATVDLLGQAGAMSTTVSATPLDTTPPAAPSALRVTVVNTENRIEVDWNVVEFDVEGHAESAPMAGYRLFRYESENADPASGVQIGGMIASPAAGGTVVAGSDSDAILRPPFGEKTFWYRVEARDAAGNVSARSAAVAGHLADITPPAPPQGLAAEGFDTFIRLRWKMNTEPDLDSYQVYRSLCHNGVCNPCEPGPRKDVAQKPAEQPSGRPSDVPEPSGTDAKPDKEIPCGGPYALVGTVSRAEAGHMAQPVVFEDHTVPAGSPLCYSYWIKALDRAQNRSGTWPVSDPATEHTVCQRLRDKTPPDAAIISELFARDRAVQVSWVGPPVQDIRAYHVYRSPKEAGPYNWVGGMTVERPPIAPKVLTEPYKPVAPVSCNTIPLVTIESMSLGSFLDATVTAKATYWYKVVGIDQSGNEAPLSKAAPISTFTFTTARPAAPAIISVTGTAASPIGLLLRWSPTFDPSSQRGFAVFKTDRPSGLYRQIGTLVAAAEYQDNNVVQGVTYWYRVLQMDLTGQVSAPSPSVSGILP